MRFVRLEVPEYTRTYTYVSLNVPLSARLVKLRQKQKPYLRKEEGRQVLGYWRQRRQQVKTGGYAKARRTLTVEITIDFGTAVADRRLEIGRPAKLSTSRAIKAQVSFTHSVVQRRVGKVRPARRRSVRVAVYGRR